MIYAARCAIAFLVVAMAVPPAYAGIFNIGASDDASSGGGSSNVVIRPAEVGSVRASNPRPTLETAPEQGRALGHAPVYQPYTPPAATVQVYKVSAAELERVGAEHLLRMQQLAPH